MSAYEHHPQSAISIFITGDYFICGSKRGNTTVALCWICLFVHGLIMPGVGKVFLYIRKLQVEGLGVWMTRGGGVALQP